MRITNGNIREYAAITSIDSIYFSELGDTMRIMAYGAQVPVSVPLTQGMQVSFISDVDCPGKLSLNYAGDSVFIENPYLLQGVSLAVDGAYATVTNTNTASEITTELSGVTSNGGFTYNGQYKSTVVLNGLTMTSKRGAAIDIQCGKRINLEIKKGTENTLVDAAGGEQKAALYCKGHLEIDKSGTLNVTGNTAHAISSKEYLKLKKSDGTINILGAVKDGLHCKQYFLGNGFTVNISNTGDDGIQAELDGEENDEGIADGTIIINGGTYNIVSNTNGSMEGTDTHTAKGLNADGDMQLNAGTINITMTGSGGKGIRVEGTYSQGTPDGNGPQLTVSTTGDAYSNNTSSGGTTGGWGGWPGGGGHGGRPGGTASGSDAKAIKVLGAINIYGGTTHVTTAKNGAEGLESKTSITISGGSHYFKCYDDCINSSGPINFSGGNTVCWSTNNDAIDSNYGRSGAITISGGNVFSYTTAGSPEEGLDCDNNSYITVSGGIGVSAGGSQGGGGWGGSSSQSVGLSTQGYYLGSSPSSYDTSYYYTLCNTSGEPLCTYKFEGRVSNSLSLLTAPNLGKGSVTVKYSTSAPTDYSAVVTNTSGEGVFYIAPSVITSGTTTTVTAK